MRIATLSMLMLATFSSYSIPATAQVPMTASEAALAAELQPIDQSLLNAIVKGDRKAWADVIGPGFTYVAEDEQVIDASRLLSLLVPPKAGDAGADFLPFKIVDYTLRLVGDTATVVHHDAEQGSHLGSRLTGIDVTTEIWQRIEGRWKLRLVHTTPIPTVPPEATLLPADIASLTGNYRAGDETVTIGSNDAGLFWQVGDTPPRHLKAEARDVLFEPGNARIRYIFQRDGSGTVTGVLRRNENRAISYTRLPR